VMGVCYLHVWGRGGVHKECWWGNVWERNRLEHLGVNGDNIKMGLQEIGCGYGLDDLPQGTDR